MLQAKFSPLCIHVTYKLNKFRVDTTPDGLRVGDVIRLACAQLGISASQQSNMAIIRNQILLERSQVLYPFSRVLLCESQRPTADPPLKRSLWQITRQSEGKRSKDILKMLAIEVFQEMVYEMQLLAHYNQHVAQFEFPQSVSILSVRTPPTWLRSIMADDNIKCECDSILDMVKDELKKHDLVPIVDGMCWSIDWKPSAEEEFVTLLTARDLNVMGYSMNDKTLFMNIHKQLRDAISLGEVSNTSLDAQKAWVRRNFLN